MINQTTDSNMTALHSAALWGRNECITALLACPETDINVLNANNDAAIHLAVANKKQNASLSIIGDSRFSLSGTNLEKLWYYAIKYDNAAIMSKLLQDPKYSDRFGLLIPCVTKFKKNDQNQVKSTSSSDNTPLLIASRHDAGSIIELIGSKDVSSMNKVDSNGFSPLFLACWNGYKNAALALIELDKKVSDEKDEGILLFRTKHDKTSVVMAACKGGSKEILIVLTKAINKRYGNVKLQRELMKYNNEGDSALFFACKYDSHEIVEYLVSTYDYIHLKLTNRTKQTPLQVAKEHHSIKTIQQIQFIDHVQQI